VSTSPAAVPVIAALTATVQQLPEQLKQSLTWDRGLEMAKHKQFTVDTGVQVYFCDPRSPCQRGTNENTNGLLRRYLPHGMNLKEVTQEQLNEIAAGGTSGPHPRTRVGLGLVRVAYRPLRRCADH
jgi:IS30 family transposase